MRTHRLGWLLALPFAFGSVAPAWALIAGGGPAKSDCYVSWQLNSEDFATSSQKQVNVDCADGDSTCDSDSVEGQCTFDVSVCAGQPLAQVTGCQPQTVTSIRFNKQGKKANLQAPANLATAGCGTATSVVVPLRTKKGRTKPSKRTKLKMVAKSTGKPKKDVDKLNLRCKPGTGGGGGGGGGPACPANPSGPDEPNELIMTVHTAGTDLDNGWRGASHNFPTPAGTTLQMCLSNCNRTDDSLCDGVINTGPTTFNRTTFGPFLPLFTAGIPVCVANNYSKTQFTGGFADLATGEVTGPLELDAAVFLTDETNVCPKCTGGTCNSGEKKDQKCSVDGVVFVAESAAADKTFQLSKDCPMSRDQLAGVLKINLPLTSGTSSLPPLPGGSVATPCVKQGGEPSGLSPLPDLCGSGGTCTAKCTGLACNSMGQDFVTGAQVCIDAKGGIAQLCCSSDPTTPCFPTRTGGVITRTGNAIAPQPPWPDPTYPKTTDCSPGNCTVQVATFCEPATGTSSVDGLAGLPGPASLILPIKTEWKTP